MGDIKPKILAQQSLNASEKIVSGSTNETSTNNITTSLDNPPTSPASNAISAVVSSNNMSAAIDTEAPATNLLPSSVMLRMSLTIVMILSLGSMFSVQMEKLAASRFIVSCARGTVLPPAPPC